MTNPAVLRHALSRATVIEGYSELVEALGFKAVPHPIDYGAQPDERINKVMPS